MIDQTEAKNSLVTTNVVPPLQEFRLELDPIKSRLLIESARAKDMSQKYINEIYSRIKILEEEAEKLSKKETIKRIEIKKLKQDASTIKSSSDSLHEKAMEDLVNSFNICSPWEANIEYKDGRPVALLIKQNKV